MATEIPPESYSEISNSCINLSTESPSKLQRSSGESLSQSPSCNSSLQSPCECFLQFVKDLSVSLNLRLKCETFPALVVTLKNLLTHEIQCDLLEIKQAIDDLYNSAHIFQTSGRNYTRIHLGSREFTLKISEFDETAGKKAEICRSLNSVTEVLNSPLELPASLIELSNTYETLMISAFEEDTLKINPQPVRSLRTPQQASPKKIEKNVNYNEISWIKQELKVLKSQAKSKLHDLVIKEKEYSQSSAVLKKERIRLAKESIGIEQASVEFVKKKEKFQRFLKTLERIVNDLLKDVEVSASQNALEDKNPEEELECLEIEAMNLEYELSKSAPESIEAIQTKINRVKTKINAIKSEKTISKTSRHSQQLRGIVSKMQFSMDINVPTSKFKQRNSQKSLTISPMPAYKTSPLTKQPRALNIAPLHIRATTPWLHPEIRSSAATPSTERLDLNRPSIFIFDEVQKNALSYKPLDQSQVLLLKEKRLKTLEQELNRKELWIKENWEKQVSDTQALELVLEERIALHKKKIGFEAKEVRAEEKLEELERLEKEVKARGVELERRIREVEAERAAVYAERRDLAEKVEEIRVFVQNNINC